MRLDDLWGEEAGELSAVPCEKLEQGMISLARGAAGLITLSANGTFFFRSLDRTLPFRITDVAQAQRVADAIRQRYAVLTSFSSEADPYFQLHIFLFLRRVNFLRVQVILAPRVRLQLQEHGYDVQDNGRLAAAFQFTDGMKDEHGAPCFAFLRTDERNVIEDAPKPQAQKDAEAQDGTEAQEEPAADAEAELEEMKETQAPQEEDRAEETEGPETPEADGASEPPMVMQIMGKDCLLFVRIQGTGIDSHAVAYRVSFSKRTKSVLHLELADGQLMFSDEQSYVAARVRDILQSSPSYIKIWNAYAEREGDFLIARARAIGTIAYKGKWTETPDGAELTLLPGTDVSHLHVGDTLEARETPPPWIDDPSMKWRDYVAWRDALVPADGDQAAAATADAPQRQPKMVRRKQPFSPRFEITGLRDGHLTVKGEKHKLGPCLYYSIAGDAKQIERRGDARRRLEPGPNASPRLGLILGANHEDATTNVAVGMEKRPHIDPRPRKQIFKNEPTTNQMTAIDIALNTPDIAVIQGPPGTGKTTVITGILQRLNELVDQGERQPGQVLVTSLQHDAVNNIIERIDQMPINSLPTVKFGGKAKEDNQTIDDAVTAWCREKAEELEARHPELRETEKERELSDAFWRYQTSPDDAHAAVFLHLARTLAREASLMEEIDRILSDLHTAEQTGGDTSLLRQIYRLRTDAPGAADDGVDSAMELYNSLAALYGEQPTKQQQARLTLLQEAAMEGAEADDALFDQLFELQQALLAEMMPTLPVEASEPREDITAVYRALRKVLARPENATANILYDFYWALRDNPSTVRKAVASYSFVFAATAQQSERKEIKKAKGLGPHDLASYDTVIVDEAARVMPGDLMIPLSQAAKRIILVGDQRQLPHIYDEEIFQELKEDGKLDNEDDIKVSMFEHLWEKARDLQKSDGIQRTVTLDQQFRMHPTLGTFISKNFYETHDDAEKFLSPLPPEAFAQSISASPVRWDHLGAARGKHHRTPSHSLVRECEADYIAELLARYLSAPENDGLTFGVISFYRAQAELVKQRLRGHIAEGRVRIGTVDEFQGMEFDVILLSMVRSGMPQISEEDLYELQREPAPEEQKAHEEFVEETGRKIYGFLTDHRLCVALSRQKRLLILVGDADLYRGAAGRIAEICEPAMVNLYQLCDAEGNVWNI